MRLNLLASLNGEYSRMECAVEGPYVVTVGMDALLDPMIAKWY